MKAIQINNNIKVYSQLPKTWKNHLNFRQADEVLQKQEGFYDVVKTEYNTETQRLGEIYWDEINEVFTYPVIDFTQSELDARKEQELEMLDNQFDQQAAKRLLRKIAEPILADENNLTEQDIEDAKMLYPQWRGIGIDYEEGEKVVHKNILYYATQPHTSEPHWSPDVAISLFGIFRVPGTITNWVQPDGAGGPNFPYYFGDRVTHIGITWQSVVANNQDGSPANVWEPGVYGWEQM
jgi:hypothetical protein